LTAYRSRSRRNLAYGLVVVPDSAPVFAVGAPTTCSRARRRGADRPSAARPRRLAALVKVAPTQLRRFWLVTTLAQSLAPLGLTSFAQNIVLLGLTALLTGLVVPYVLKEVDDRKAIRQTEREADLARQAKLIEAQAKFLDDITGLLWRWRYLAIKVAYYGGLGIEDQYEAAWREYDESIWDVLNDVRSEVSVSRRLVSEPAYRALRHIYEEDMVRVDRQLSGARVAQSGEPRQAALSELNRNIYSAVTDRIDETLADVASEIGLSSASPGAAIRR